MRIGGGNRGIEQVLWRSSDVPRGTYSRGMSEFRSVITNKVMAILKYPELISQCCPIFYVLCMSADEVSPRGIFCSRNSIDSVRYSFHDSFPRRLLRMCPRQSRPHDRLNHRPKPSVACPNQRGQQNYIFSSAATFRRVRRQTTQGKLAIASKAAFLSGKHILASNSL